MGETCPELKQTLVLSYDTTCLAKYTLASASLLPAPRGPFRSGARTFLVSDATLRKATNTRKKTRGTRMRQEQKDQSGKWEKR